MKQACNILLLAIIIWSCGGGAKKGKLPRISTRAAYRMIQHYKDSLVPHNVNALIRYTRFNEEALEDGCDDAQITFWTAADTLTHKPLIIVECRGHKGSDSAYFYSMNTFNITICPPPTTPPCDTSNLQDFADM